MHFYSKLIAPTAPNGYRQVVGTGYIEPAAWEDGMSERTVTAALIIIGNEILSGRTQDANLAFLAQELNEVGIQLREVRIVPDAEADIVEAVNACRARHDHVFTTGGIGPTHDDITSASVAKAFGVDVRLPPRGRAPAARLLPAREAQRRAPEDGPDARRGRADRQSGQRGARASPSATSTSCPGVPSILQAMFAGLKPRLQGGAVVRSRTITVVCPEGDIARPLARDPGPLAHGRDRQLPVHAPGQLRHQPGPAQRRRGRHRRGGRGDPGRGARPAASRCWTCSERRDWATPPRRHGARLAESVDARDLKSRARKGVPVRVRQRAPGFSKS